jgi:imidazolonepropionase-like amidohydrolase
VPAKITMKNLKIWNGIDGSIDSGVDALAFEDGKITFVGSSEDLDRDAVDMGGMTAIPGLIDAHIHLCLNPEEKDPLQQESPGRDDLLQQMAGRAKTMVQAGITSARDLGGGQWLELEIRDRINAGELPGPRLVCAGQPITSPQGHCHFWRGEAANKEEALDVLARQVEHNVDLIKVMATGGNITKGSRPVDAQFDEEALSVIVTAANERGFRVAAHCHGTSGIRNAAAAGVTTIEHCSWVGEEGWGKAFDPDVVATIVEKNAWVSPTINSGWKRFVGNKEFEKMIRKNYSRMRSAGVKLIASTDAGIPNVLHERLPLAIPVFAHFADLSPVEALKSATSDCAEAIGLGEITGQINDGFAADLILFNGDPTNDLQVLASPALIYKGGEQVFAV